MNGVNKSVFPGPTQGLQQAVMISVPAAFIVAALGMTLAPRSVKADHARMLAAGPAP